MPQANDFKSVVWVPLGQLLEQGTGGGFFFGWGRNVIWWRMKVTSQVPMVSYKAVLGGLRVM